MSSHAWVEMDIKMNILMHDVETYCPGAALTSISILTINKSREQGNDCENISLSR